MKKLIAIALLAAGVVGCGTVYSKVGDPDGGYIAPTGSPHYQVKSHSLYAWDGTDWYVCRSPYYDMGYINGAHVALPEVWMKAGGSRIMTYYRSPVTFVHMEHRPEFRPSF